MEKGGSFLTRFKLNLKKRLALSYLKWLIPLMAFTFLFLGFEIYSNVYTELLQQNRALSENITHQTNMALKIWIDDQVNILQQIAHNPQVIASLSDPTNESLREDAANYLKNMEKQYPYFENIPIAAKFADSQTIMVPVNGKLVPVKNGQYLADSLDGETIGKAGTNTSFIKAIYEGKPVFMSEVFLSLRRGNPVVSIAAPVMKDGQLIGVAAVGLPMDSFLEKLIAPTKIGSTGHLMMIDGRGAIIAHPNKDKILKPESQEMFQPVSSKILQGETQFDLPDQGIDKEYLTTEFSDEGVTLAYPWYIVLVQDKAEILTGTTKILTIIIGLCILIYILLIAIIFGLTRRLVVKPLDILGNHFKAMAEGDLSQVENTMLDDSCQNEIGELNRSYRKMTENLCDLVQEVNSSSSQVTTTSQKLKEAAEESSKATEQIAVSIQNVALGVEHQTKDINEAKGTIARMAQSMQGISGSITQANDAAKQTAQVAENGNTAVQKVVRQMDSINSSVQESAKVVLALGTKSNEISRIVEVITGIAEQTNLLALNAAIEAARAGELGNGFAVVAEEVRKLAEQSACASQEISGLVTEIQGETHNAVDAMERGTQEVMSGTQIAQEAVDGFQTILKATEQVASQISEISVTIKEMSLSAEEIAARVEGVAKVSENSLSGTQAVAAASEEQNATMEEVTSSLEELSQMAEKLNNLINKFTL